jgi:hypothetical protein
MMRKVMLGVLFVATMAVGASYTIGPRPASAAHFTHWVHVKAPFAGKFARATPDTYPTVTASPTAATGPPTTMRLPGRQERSASRRVRDMLLADTSWSSPRRPA